MGYGSLLAEYVFSGFQVLIWLVLAYFLAVGENGIDLNTLADIDLDLLTLILFLLIPIVYPLGILVDNLAQILLLRWHNEIKDTYFKDAHGLSLRLIMFSENEGLNQYLSSIRSVSRMSRSAAVNFFFIFGLLALNGIFTLEDELNGKQLEFVIINILLGIFCVVISLISWHTNTLNYYRKVSVGLKFMNEKLGIRKKKE